jgi:hypothetical protein
MEHCTIRLAPEQGVLEGPVTHEYDLSAQGALGGIFFGGWGNWGEWIDKDRVGSKPT